MTTKTDTSATPTIDPINQDAKPAEPKTNVKVVSERPPTVVLTKQQSRDRLKAVMKGEDPDKVAPLETPKPVNAGEPAEPKAKPEKKPKKPKEAPEAKKSAPPPAPAAPPPAKAKTEASEPPAAPAPEPAAPAAPAPAAPKDPSRAEVEKRARAVSRDAARVEARARQLEQAEQAVQETLRKWDPSNENFVDELEAHFKAQGKDFTAALRTWAAKKRGQAPQPGQPAAPGAPPVQAAAPPAPAAAPPPDPEIEALKAEHRKLKAEKAKTHWMAHFKGEIVKAPPAPDTHPTIAEFDEDYLSEVMTLTASNVYRLHKIQLDTLQLYDMIEEAEAEERKAQQAKLKRKPATTGSAPEREPAGTQSRQHEPSKAIDVPSRARAGSTATTNPTGSKSKINRERLKEIHAGRG